jgi:hypothetical protein
MQGDPEDLLLHAAVMFLLGLAAGVLLALLA